QKGQIAFKAIMQSDRVSPLNGHLEVVPSEYFRIGRTFRPQLEMIESYSDEMTMQEFAEARSLGERHPNWVDVIVETASYRQWLHKHLKDKFISDIALGDLLPDEADRRLGALGFEALNSPEEAPDLMAQKRWRLIATLVWIATRDISLTSKISSDCKSYRNADISLTLRRAYKIQNGAKPNWPMQSLKLAWEQELCQAMADGNISAFATRVSLNVLSGLSQNETGLKFPPDNAPGAPLEHRIDDDDVNAAIVPKDRVLAHSWFEWHNATLPRDRILELWPELTEHDTTISHTRLSQNSITSPNFNWGLYQAMAWVLWLDMESVQQFSGSDALICLAAACQDGGKSMDAAKMAILEAVKSGKIAARALDKYSCWFELSLIDLTDAEITMEQNGGVIHYGGKLKPMVLNEMRFSEAQLMLEWPSPTNDLLSSQPYVAVRPVSEAELSSWFGTFRSQSTSQTRDKIEQAGKAHFGDKVTLTRLRQLYKSIAPMGGNKRGRKSANFNSATSELPELPENREAKS
ncbi:MAG: hypothetical protein KGO94_09955, partial [Alphaproteobacteria bacterium]|nr:hypothetical protein [Alphaproteobacteria bacterium]